MQRELNHWDYLGISSIALSVALVIVSLMFLDKND